MKRIITMLVLFATLLSIGQSAVFAAASTASSDKSLWDITRLGGADRIETANLICRAGWADALADGSAVGSMDGDFKDNAGNGTVSSGSDVSPSDLSPTDIPSSSDIQPDAPVCAIIANGYSFADALAGAPLAAAVNAPILLTNGTDLRDSVISELERIGAERVYILGGELAVSAQAERELDSIDCEVVRLAGTTRYETAVAIAEELERISGKPADTIFIAYGYNYPDALSAGAVAGLLGAPILYSSAAGTPDTATADLIRAAGNADIVILGGTSAIAADAEKNFGVLTQGSTRRISGATRYATAIELCSEYLYLFRGKDVILASGNDFPDALAGGAFAASVSSPMLLINSQLHTDGLYDFIRSIAPGKIYILGGTVAVSDHIVNTILSGGTVTRPTTTTTTTTAPVSTPGVRGDHIQRRITVKNDTAKVYTERTASSSVVAVVKKNASFTVLDEQPDSRDQYTWFQIKVNGKTGWICRTEVTIANTFITIAEKAFSAGNKAVIYLSPSRQGTNPYATGNTSEQKEMEAVGKIIKKILDAEYDCITYIADPDIKINDRTDEALSYGADIYIAIHSNATGTSAVGFGASSYYFPACAQGKLLSQNVVAELNKIAPRKTTLAQQVVNGMNSFYGIGYSEVRGPSDAGMVAILAETEFHDNAVGSNWIRTHHNEIARAYVNAIVETFGIPKK